MEDIELQKIWQQYDQQLSFSKAINLQSWSLHLHCVEMVQNQKTESKLSSLVKFKIWAVVLGVVWIFFLGALVYENQFRNPYFGISISAILLFNLYAVIAYISQIVLIKQINYDGPITAIQEKLARLEAATIASTRILWLQMPFYTTWFWHSSWIHYNDPVFWLVIFPITFCFILLAVFLYQNIKAENLHKKWVRMLMMAGPEYKSVIEAGAFLKEIEAFKKEMP